MDFNAREINIFIQFSVIILGVYSLFHIMSNFMKVRQKLKPLEKKSVIKLCISGFVANVADTLGIGSYVIIVAFNRFWPIINPKHLPGTLNAHGVIPAIIQCLAFLTLVKIDITTLSILLVGTSFGALMGSRIVAGFDKTKIRLSMVAAYMIMAVLVFSNQLQLLPIGGDAYSLEGIKLFAAFIFMFIVGIFPAIGVGGYAPIQMALFVLGLNPLVAWPVMTTSGAIQQGIAAATFAKSKKVDFKEAGVLSLAGIVGTLIAIPFITAFDAYFLRWLLFIIVIYNIYTILKDLRK